MPPPTCPYDPGVLKGAPIGMFHCPLCGEMQIAGLAHLPPEEEEPDWDALGLGEERRGGVGGPTPEGG